MATSPGGRGGATVLESAKISFPHFGANIIGSISIASFYDNFKDGKIEDSKIAKDLQNIVTVFETKI
jgi:hypothetical protein